MSSKTVIRPTIGQPAPAVTPAAATPVVDSNIMRLPQMSDGQTSSGRLFGPDVVQPRELSPGEVQGLTLIGVDPTVPVPKDALERLASLSPETLARLRAPSPEYTRAVEAATASPVVPQKPVRIEDLPQAEQDRARQVMARMLGEAEGSTPPANPSREKRVVTFPVVPDAPVTAPLPPPPPQPAPVSPAPPPVDDATSDAGGAGLTTPICPRCGFDCRQQDAVTLTDEDKVSFLSCILAIPSRKFEKEYPRYSGRLVLRFRELSPLEQDEATRATHRLVTRDTEAGNVGTMLYYANLGATYRAILSLVKLENSTDCYDLSGAYQEASRQGKSVEEYVKWVIGTAVPTDSLLVVVRRAFEDFSQLCQKLREAASLSDF